MVIIDYFKKWYKERVSRRVFVICALLTLVMLVLGSIDGLGFLLYGAIISAIIATFASIGDTWEDYKIFKIVMAKIPLDDLHTEDIADIKRQKRKFRGTLAVKVIFIIIFVALMTQGGV